MYFLFDFPLGQYVWHVKKSFVCPEIVSSSPIELRSKFLQKRFPLFVHHVVGCEYRYIGWLWFHLPLSPLKNVGWVGSLTNASSIIIFLVSSCVSFRRTMEEPSRRYDTSHFQTTRHGTNSVRRPCHVKVRRVSSHLFSTTNHGL